MDEQIKKALTIPNPAYVDAKKYGRWLKGIPKSLKYYKEREAGFKVLIATIQLIGEGFDCSSLTVLVMATPVVFRGKLTQAVGRVLRPQEGKKPLVIDFTDSKIGLLGFRAKQRRREGQNGLLQNCNNYTFGHCIFWDAQQILFAPQTQ